MHNKTLKLRTLPLFVCWFFDDNYTHNLHTNWNIVKMLRSNKDSVLHFKFDNNEVNSVERQFAILALHSEKENK